MKGCVHVFITALQIYFGANDPELIIDASFIYHLSMVCDPSTINLEPG